VRFDPEARLYWISDNSLPYSTAILMLLADRVLDHGLHGGAASLFLLLRAARIASGLNDLARNGQVR